ncbi:hypothetical protein, partial [Salmonella enterica]|uniref:hypothetical protein n=1 Tax=Salmonella enterica TaxID=28901 RepID=UPI0011BD8665
TQAAPRERDGRRLPLNIAIMMNGSSGQATNSSVIIGCDTVVCGYDHEQSMVITAHGFAMPVKEAFAPVLKLRKWLNPVSLVP